MSPTPGPLETRKQKRMVSPMTEVGVFGGAGLRSQVLEAVEQMIGYLTVDWRSSDAQSNPQRSGILC